jgi:hypothetical protein
MIFPTATRARVLGYDDLRPSDGAQRALHERRRRRRARFKMQRNAAFHDRCHQHGIKRRTVDTALPEFRESIARARGTEPEFGDAYARACKARLRAL